MGGDTPVGRGGQPAEQEESTPAHTMSRPTAHGTPQFSPIPGRLPHGYARYNQNDRRYPNNGHNYRPEVSHNEGEPRATMAVAKALNKLTENFARMQNQPLMTSALSDIDWFDGTDKSNTMSWLDQVEVVAERTTKHH